MRGKVTTLFGQSAPVEGVAAIIEGDDSAQYFIPEVPEGIDDGSKVEFEASEGTTIIYKINLVKSAQGAPEPVTG